MNFWQWVFLIVVLYLALKSLFSYLLRKYDWHFWYKTIYLKSYHWRFLKWRKRTWVLLTKGVVNCEKCGSKSGLQYHHINYARLWHERLSDLQIICNRCHRKGPGRI